MNMAYHSNTVYCFFSIGLVPSQSCQLNKTCSKWKKFKAFCFSTKAITAQQYCIRYLRNTDCNLKSLKGKFTIFDVDVQLMFMVFLVN